ncbi:hypothetical protein [Luteimonas sp. FCS-9]|uniref:hypothetical protein n=1 Tax=Luteimonas sp. FCS-9 TaxID=1547516 RepID=UPI00063E96A4|nr:hypothetical protein [Luteimonas sp. FCS-9]KLI99900.1 hypothetical protein WQ56_10920 [Luteimonas sp. FCS-9]
MRSLLAAIAAPLLLAACGATPQHTSADRAPLEAATIAGSAESPDPVLERVRDLQRRGVVEDVVVQESFPVQIRLRAPRHVIDELEAMPRTGAARSTAPR